MNTGIMKSAIKLKLSIVDELFAHLPDKVRSQAQDIKGEVLAAVEQAVLEHKAENQEDSGKKKISMINVE